MLKNLFIIGWRNFLKNSVFSFVNILGLAIGLSCSILILLWVEDETSFDRFHENHNRIFRVLQDMTFADQTTWAITQGPLSEALKDEVAEIELVTRVAYGQWNIRYSENEYDEFAIYGDPAFLEIFSFEMVEGDRAGALINPNSAVLTQSTARKIFGEESAVGKSFTLYNQFEILVTGVIKDVPINSHLQFDLIGTIEFSKSFGYSVDRWNNSMFGTYVLIANNTSPEIVNEKIKDILDDKPTIEDGSKLRLQPVTDIHLSSGIDFNDGGGGNKQYVVIFFISALFILTVACINFMNLSTAQAGRRSKEVGLRKSVGAHRYQLIYQFIFESSLMAVLAFGLALLMVEAILPFFNDFAGKQLEIDYLNIRYLVASLLLLLLTGLMAGFYPAFYLSSYSPIVALKGGQSVVSGNTGIRKVLVVFQCTISVILLIGTLAVYQQVHYLSNKDIGFNKENLLYIRLTDNLREHLQSIKSEFLQYPGILHAAGTGPLTGYWWSNNQWTWEGKQPDTDILFRGASVDYGYYETMGIKLVEGRSFSPDFESDSMAIIINQTAARLIGFMDPIGKTVKNTTENPLTYHIVGIAEDYNFRSLYYDIEPLIMSLRPQYSNFLLLRIKGSNLEETLSFVKNKWTELSPDDKINYGFLDQRFESLYRAEERIGKVLNAFSFLALVVLSLGLFGLLGFSMSQRNKEISIRKVFGANTSRILLSLSKDYMKLLVISILIAVPVANYFITEWLNTFAYRVDIPLKVFWIPAIILAGVSMLIILSQIYRATRINVSETLRSE